MMTQEPDAVYEAYQPVAMKIQGDDFVVRACDGDNEYVYLAVKRRAAYLVTEVYPGLTQKSTTLREATEVADLTLSRGKHKSIEAVVREIGEVMFADFEFDGSGNAIVVASRDVPRKGSALALVR